MENFARGGRSTALRTMLRTREVVVRASGGTGSLRASPRPLVLGTTIAVLVLVWLATVGALVVSRRDSAVASADLAKRHALYEAEVARLTRRAQALERRQALIEEALRLESEPAAAAGSRPAALAVRISANALTGATLDAIERRQLASIARLTARADARADAAETAIRRMGLNPNLMVARAGDSAAQGGPLLAADTSDPRLRALAASLARLNALETALAAVPHNAPANLAYISSGFGYRSDPFTGEAAMHAGLDFRGPLGAPIYAAANGTVSFAGIKSGYGNCIEISHGNGVVTRYAHMSGFRAQVGQAVAAGDVIGAIGSTGRSTGPHLHFEVRINDQAVDPRRFLTVA